MILFLSLFTILISCILVLNNWKTNKNVIFLASLFVILAIYGLGQYAVVESKSVYWTVVYYNNFMPLMLLLGPFLFFYIRGVLTPKKKFTAKDILHFLPFVVNFLAIVPYYLTSYAYKEHLAKNIIANVNLLLVYKVNVLFSPAVNFLLRPVCFMIYILYSLYFVIRYLKRKSNKHNVPFRDLVIGHQWFFGLLLVLMMMIGCYFIACYIFVRTSSYENSSSFGWYFAVTEISFIFIAFHLLFYPTILYGFSNGVKETKKKINTSNKETEKTSEVAVFFLSEQEFNDIVTENDPYSDLAQRIRNYFTTEKPYLKPTFSMRDLADALDAKENHVLYCFTAIFKISFLKLRNQLRIEHAKELLKNNTHENLTIDAIGQISGFPTRSNFYTAFKKMVGCSPKDYLKSIEKIS